MLHALIGVGINSSITTAVNIIGTTPNPITFAINTKRSSSGRIIDSNLVCIVAITMCSDYSLIGLA